MRQRTPSTTLTAITQSVVFPSAILARAMSLLSAFLGELYLSKKKFSLPPRPLALKRVVGLLLPPQLNSDCSIGARKADSVASLSRDVVSTISFLVFHK